MVVARPVVGRAGLPLRRRSARVHVVTHGPTRQLAWQLGDLARAQRGESAADAAHEDVGRQVLVLEALAWGASIYVSQ